MKILPLLVLVPLVTGCKQRPQAPQPVGTPAAMQEPSSSLTKRYSGSANLVEELYQELAEADTALRTADKMINQALDACNDTLAVHHLYQEKTASGCMLPGWR
jgi:hypothetical protein